MQCAGRVCLVCGRYKSFHTVGCCIGVTIIQILISFFPFVVEGKRERKREQRCVDCLSASVLSEIRVRGHRHFVFKEIFVILYFNNAF